jgi:hypothetical protein
MCPVRCRLNLYILFRRNSVFVGFGGRGGVEARVDASSNTSAVALRIVGGDEKGSIESETVKYGDVSRGTQTQE